MLHGDVANLSTRTLMRGEEPAVRLVEKCGIEYLFMIARIFSAGAIEPCQIRNEAALRFNFRVKKLFEGDKYFNETFFHLTIGSGTAFIIFHQVCEGVSGPTQVGDKTPQPF